MPYTYTSTYKIWNVRARVTGIRKTVPSGDLKVVEFGFEYALFPVALLREHFEELFRVREIGTPGGVHDFGC